MKIMNAKQKTLTYVAVSVIALSATTAHGLIVSFGQQEIADAGAGCVAGYTSDHGVTAYFRGNTATLNARLAALTKGDRRPGSIKVVLHAGASKIDNPEETQLVDPKQASKPMKAL